MQAEAVGCSIKCVNLQTAALATFSPTSVIENLLWMAVSRVGSSSFCFLTVLSGPFRDDSSHNNKGTAVNVPENKIPS